MAAKKGRSRKKNRGRATPASPSPANRAAAASTTAATRDRDARLSVSERLPALDPELRDRLLLALLTLDGLVVGLLGVAFTYQRFGGVAIPVAALLAGLANAALLWLAAGHTSSGWRWAPLGAWGLVVLVAGAVTGPGGNVVLSTSPNYLVQTLLLLVLGVAPAVVLSRTGRLPDPEA